MARVMSTANSTPKDNRHSRHGKIDHSWRAGFELHAVTLGGHGLVGHLGGIVGGSGHVLDHYGLFLGGLDEIIQAVFIGSARVTMSVSSERSSGVVAKLCNSWPPAITVVQVALGQIQAAPCRFSRGNRGLRYVSAKMLDQAFHLYAGCSDPSHEPRHPGPRPWPWPSSDSSLASVSPEDCRAAAASTTVLRVSSRVFSVSRYRFRPAS